ncbi:class-II fumarase/aspartase family protein [Saccharopolyspora sp. 5N708]|uniref:class-II fumarase/aspartase family protein n=1 Tax=Saccharopolyspora sp. 5N708 TaxID=3457424 RepID=UPI003FCF5096
MPLEIIKSTDGRVPDPGIRALYTLDSRWQQWLDVEAALALAQARVGLVPQAAADRISAVARLDLLDRERIEEANRRTAHTIVPLIWELARVVGPEAGGWVHWGATTQNILQNGDALALRQVHRRFLDLLRRTLAGLADLTERTADLPTAGRTHGQHAIPVTFGFKTGAWIDELLRHVERLESAGRRALVVVLGGAAGTFAAMGPLGPQVQSELADVLDLGEVTHPARSITDQLAEYVAVLGLLAGTTEKIAREVYSLMRTEYGEVEEPLPAGTVGSSTMPQKRNPHVCQDIIARSASVRAAVPMAMEAMMTEHEADRSRHLLMQEALSTACIAMGDVLARLVHVTDGLTIHPDRMAANLDLTGGLIMSESVMMRLGEALGRQHAHDLVYTAAQEAAAGGPPFADRLRSDPDIAAHLDAAAIADLLNPASYLGQAPAIARDAAARARAAVASLNPPTEGPEA